MEWKENELNFIDKCSKEIEELHSDSEIDKFIKGHRVNHHFLISENFEVKFFLGVHVAIYGYEHFMIICRKASQTTDSVLTLSLNLFMDDGTLDNFDDAYINGIQWHVPHGVTPTDQKIKGQLKSGLKHYSDHLGIKELVDRAIDSAKIERVEGL